MERCYASLSTLGYIDGHRSRQEKVELHESTKIIVCIANKDTIADNNKPCLALINWRTSGRLVTIPEPRGKKSLQQTKQIHKVFKPLIKKTAAKLPYVKFSLSGVKSSREQQYDRTFALSQKQLEN